jgi:cytochrome b561
MAAFGATGSVLVAAGALIAGVSPAQAANFASQPDTQVAVFMVPLTLLLLVLLFEVARFVWRGTMPTRAPLPAPRPTNWARTGEDS